MSGSITNASANSGSKFIGSGSDSIVLLASGDAYGPSGAPGADAQFTLNVDGQQIGGLQNASASHAAGQTEAFTFQGNFAPGPHAITVTFANNSGTQGDQTNFGRGGDRNLYINGVSYDGQTVSSSTTPIYTSPLFEPNGPNDPGNAVFNITDTTPILPGSQPSPTTTPGPIDIGTGSDTVSLHVSEDPFEGDAQFNVAVDGKQVGGTLTTTAISWEGQQQTVNLHGAWGYGNHTITVTYISDRIGATTAEGFAVDNVDQNLYVNSISYDGIQAGGTPWELATHGSIDFNVGAGGQASMNASAPTGNTTSTSATNTSVESGNDSTSGGTIQLASSDAGGTETTTSPTTSDAASITSTSLNNGNESATTGMTFVQPPTSSSTAVSEQNQSGASFGTVQDITGNQTTAPAFNSDLMTQAAATSGVADTSRGGMGVFWSHHTMFQPTIAHQG